LNFCKNLWSYHGNAEDTVNVDVFQNWLEKSSEDVFLNQKCYEVHSHHSHEDVDHGDHIHSSRDIVEQTAVEKEVLAVGEQFSNFLVNTLVRKEIITWDEIRLVVEKIESMGSKSEGARAVVKAWKDDEFKKRLLEDANSAFDELGIQASNTTSVTILKVLENTEEIHNLIVCTLCSCYPSNILGVSPSWYKSRNYRARAVKEPRKLLIEFGTIIPDTKILKVHDSTSDLRFMVLPERPVGSENYSEDELIALVTRDSLLGVSVLSI